MKNEDMPASPQSGFTDGDHPWCSVDCGGEGETKREKAFWQVYSALLASPNTTSVNEGDIASVAMTLVDEGFKALGENDQ
jgi:hypothetical protein